jgi:uncharacterized protein (DUF924 family)
MALWFESGRAHDRDIARRFSSDHAAAVHGDLDHWATTPRGRLALILILDQFSRHLYRETPRAFAQDARAQELTLGGLDQGFDLDLHPVERTFFYLPLEHSEDRALQRRSVEVFEALVASMPAAYLDRYQGFLDYAVRHFEVIERFGRFPDLNLILGRKSTPPEVEFLRQPGSSFL